MKKLLTFVILSCSVAFGGDVNPKSNPAPLSDNEAKIDLSAAKKIYAIYYASNHAKI